MATPSIKQFLDDVRATVATVRDLKAVVRPPEQVPPDGPFVLVEFGGMAVTLGNLEETTFTAVLNVCVPALGAYPQECETVEAVVPEVLAAFRGNVQLAGEAIVLPTISVGATAPISYAQMPLVAVAITIQAQAYSERVNDFTL